MSQQCEGINRRGTQCRLRVKGSSYCRFHQSQQKSSPMPSQQYAPIKATVYQASPNIQKLVKKTPVKTISAPKPTSEQEWPCCICLDENVAEKDLLVCRHSICLSCLSRLAQRRCPVCRQQLEGQLVTPAVISSIERRQQIQQEESLARDELMARITYYNPQIVDKIYDLDIGQLENLLEKERLIYEILNLDPGIDRDQLEDRDLEDLQAIRLAIEL